MHLPAIPGLGVLLALVWWVLFWRILAEGPVDTVPHRSPLEAAAGIDAVRGPSPFPAESPVLLIPRHSWLEPAAGFAELGGLSPILAEGRVGAVPSHSWLGPAVSIRGVVPGQSLRRTLWVRFPAIPGRGLLLDFVGWVLPSKPSRRVLWLPFPAIPSWHLLLTLLGWVVPRQS